MTVSTDSNGHLVWTYDSQFETTGASQTRETLYIFENQIDTSGTSHGFPPTYLTYDLVSITNRIEIRAYLYDAPSGYLLGDNYAITTPQGSLNADGTVADYQIFTMNNDLNITEQNTSTVAAYTSAETHQKVYDVQKLGWYNNDGVALLGKQGSQLDLGSIDLTLNATASTVYSGTASNIIIKAATYLWGATATTWKVITLNGTLLNGGTFDCDIDYHSGASTTLTNVTCNGTLDINTAGSYTLDSCTINEVTNSSGGNITIDLVNGSTITTNTWPNITLEQNITITAPNILDDSRVQIYNVTKSLELDNAVVSGGSGAVCIENLLSSDIDNGDTIRIRATYQVGTTAKLPLTATGIVTASGLTFIDSQLDDTIYNTIWLDGSLITEFDSDFVNNEIDIIVAANFSAHSLYARYVHFTTLEDGIRIFFGAVIAEDLWNIKNDVSVLSMYLNNNTSSNLIQTDNVRLYRSDGAYPARTTTTGGGGMDIVWRNQILIAETPTSWLTPSESSQLNSISTTVSSNLDAKTSKALTTNKFIWLK